jgi:hypothetical protein
MMAKLYPLMSLLAFSDPTETGLVFAQNGDKTDKIQKNNDLY